MALLNAKNNSMQQKLHWNTSINDKCHAGYIIDIILQHSSSTEFLRCKKKATRLRIVSFFVHSSTLIYYWHSIHTKAGLLLLLLLKHKEQFVSVWIK